MSNDYVTTLLVRDKLAEFRREADQDRLARLVRTDRPARHWWERLMLFRVGAAAGADPRSATPRRMASRHLAGGHSAR